MSNGTTAGAKSSLGSVLLVDDENHITTLLKYNLEAEGYVVGVESDARRAAESDLTPYRLVLADAMDQDFDGLGFLHSIKSNPLTAHIPVIIVAHSDSEDDIIAAFDEGADDYIMKPFSLRELVARVKSILRRNPVFGSTGKSGAVISIGRLEIDLSTRIARYDGNPLSLTKTEFSILAQLARNRGAYFNRRQIYENVWVGEDFHDNDRVVDTNISRLRKKLGEAASLIVNKSGMGYTIL